MLFRMCQSQCSIYLVGRNVVEAFSGKTFSSLFPCLFGRLKQSECAHDVGSGKSERIFDRSVDMTFCCEVDHTVYAEVGKQLSHEPEIGYVAFDKTIVGAVLDIFQIGEIPRICKFVEIDYAAVGIFGHKESDDMTAYEARASCDQYIVLEIHIIWFMYANIQVLNIKRKAAVHVLHRGLIGCRWQTAVGQSILTTR